MKAWIFLLVAGLLETAWAIGLKYSEGFTKLWPSVGTVIALSVSLLLLGIAIRDLPVGTAYPVWVGVGAVGAAIFGMVYLGESTSPWRILFLCLLILSLVGLKFAPN